MTNQLFSAFLMAIGAVPRLVQARRFGRALGRTQNRDGNLFPSSKLPHDTSQRLVKISAIVGLSITLGLNASATADPITINIRFTNTVTGTITIDTTTVNGTQGVSGGFTASVSLSDLERFLGQDHLNWFQKITSINPPSPGLNPPLIDPISGGLDNQWADDRPWYWDEYLPNPVPPGKDVDEAYQLSNNISSDGMTLHYEDGPGGFDAGTVIDFTTFLISDFGNKTYNVLGTGFTWEAMINADGSTSITSLKADAQFTTEYADEIKNDFHYTMVPEPTSLHTLFLGAMCVLGLRQIRRRVPKVVFDQCSPPSPAQPS